MQAVLPEIGRAAPAPAGQRGPQQPDAECQESGAERRLTERGLVLLRCHGHPINDADFISERDSFDRHGAANSLRCACSVAAVLDYDAAAARADRGFSAVISAQRCIASMNSE